MADPSAEMIEAGAQAINTRQVLTIPEMQAGQSISEVHAQLAYRAMRPLEPSPTIGAGDGELREGFDPCPYCKQYSHSIGDDKLTDAFNHFQSMIAHPMRGHPMGDAFDEQTRDAAQVLMTAALGNKGEA